MNDEDENLSGFPNPPSSSSNEKGWDKVKRLSVNDKSTRQQRQQSENDNKSSHRWNTVYHLISSTPSNTKSFLGVEDGKSLVNWQERTLKVLRSNRIFGGQIDDKAVGDYLKQLQDSNLADQTDPFSMYNLTGTATRSSGDRDKIRQNESVVNIAYKKARGLLRKKDKKAGLQLRRVKHDIRAEFEQSDEDEPVHDVDQADGPMDACCPESPFRRFGVNFCDRLCDNYIDRSDYSNMLKEVKQHRPYFTYWITFVQIVICIVSLIAYGISPVGFSFSQFKGLATTINLEKQLISYPVKQNFWIGPAVADLIHLGAKYAPCMRNDSNIYKAIQIDREIERQSACCIRNDRGGCVQTNKEECSHLLSRWSKFNGTLNDTGSVCGLDRRFCQDVGVDTWANDITLWPICQKTNEVIPRIPENEHMRCEIIGRPCCVGVQGECVITTREHCDLRKGYFHENAHLCSQVDCMQFICGMVDFLNNKSPDQVYRLFTSIFIHAGIIQLAITVLFHIFILRDVEKFAGCVRVSIVYLGSGIIGNLASAIFLSYQAEVGPCGAQSGIIACLYVEMFHARKFYKSPCLAFLKTLPIILFLFGIGFLPMIDNYANIFGFIAGLLLCSVVFPDVNLQGKCRRIIIIVTTAILFVALTTALIIFFYIKPIDQCDKCKLLSCPFSSNFCLNMDFNITRIRSLKN